VFDATCAQTAGDDLCSRHLIEDAVNFLLVTKQLEKKVLNENTFLILPESAQQDGDYQDWW